MGPCGSASIYPWKASEVSTFPPEFLSNAFGCQVRRALFQFHNERGINRKQLKVSHSLIKAKTGPDQAHISTNPERESGGKGCPISVFNINHVMFSPPSSEKACCPPHPRVCMNSIQSQSPLKTWVPASWVPRGGEGTLARRPAAGLPPRGLAGPCPQPRAQHRLMDAEGTQVTGVRTDLRWCTHRWGGSDKWPRSLANSHLEALTHPVHMFIFGDEMREREFHAGVDSTPSQFRFSPCAPHMCPTMETDQCVPSHFTDGTLRPRV